MTPSTSDPRIDPPYYIADNGMQAIDVIEAFHLSLHVGCAVKYLLRAGRKTTTDEKTDLRKAMWYLNRRIDQLSKLHPSPPAEKPTNSEQCPSCRGSGGWIAVDGGYRTCVRCNATGSIPHPLRSP